MNTEKELQRIIRFYESSCNKAIVLFCKKQDIDFDGWIGDEIGGIASFCSQYFFNFSDILFDLTTNQPKGLILEWQSSDVEFNLFNDNPQRINYKSYSMGLRHTDLSKRINHDIF